MVGNRDMGRGAADMGCDTEAPLGRDTGGDAGGLGGLYRSIRDSMWEVLMVHGIMGGSRYGLWGEVVTLGVWRGRLR